MPGTSSEDTRRTKVLFYGSPPVTYGGAGFYKYISSKGRNPFLDLLRRIFQLEVFTWTKRAAYQWQQRTVYLVDAIPMLLKLTKRALDADLIIALGYPAILELILLLLISKLRRIPIIVRDTHWYWPKTKLSMLLWHIYFKLLRYVDGIVCPGKASYKYWKSLGFENVSIVHYYALESYMPKCSMERLAAIKKKYGIVDKESKVVILYLGRLIRKKGVDLLVRAFSEIKEDKAFLVIAGDGPMRDYLERLTISLGVRSRVALVGPMPEKDKRCVYRLADIFVYVPIIESIPEEWPIAPLEAMGEGVPTVVSTAVGSIPDLLGGIIVVKWGDAHSLARVLERLIHNEELRTEYSKRALRVYASLVDSRRVYREVLQAMLSTLTRRR